MTNVYQSPLPFAFADAQTYSGNGQTYSEKGKKSLWLQENQSGMNKRQYTVQNNTILLMAYLHTNADISWDWKVH